MTDLLSLENKFYKELRNAFVDHYHGKTIDIKFSTERTYEYHLNGIITKYEISEEVYKIKIKMIKSYKTLFNDDLKIIRNAH